MGKGATSEGAISSGLLMCGGGVRSILLLTLVAMSIDYGACLFLCLLLLAVWGSMGMFVVYRPFLKIVFSESLIGSGSSSNTILLLFFRSLTTLLTASVLNTGCT